MDTYAWWYTDMTDDNNSSRPSAAQLQQLKDQGYSPTVHKGPRHYLTGETDYATWVADKRSSLDDTEEHEDDHWPAPDPGTLSAFSQRSKEEKETVYKFFPAKIIFNGESMSLYGVFQFDLTAQEVQEIVDLTRRFESEGWFDAKLPWDYEKKLVVNSLKFDFNFSNAVQEAVFYDIYKGDIKAAGFIGCFPYDRIDTQYREKTRIDGKHPKD
ncbi:Hypothetical predicted protein [Lecanosticta acicola]|uniref:Uncharacterized protein n=1 Tax=Lecanosticta acicola TaxID=111012 RepID=A0AAI8YVL4_9PEZI|nr:Hypothetical predicted protein [Lecanosticta acicola]